MASNLIKIHISLLFWLIISIPNCHAETMSYFVYNGPGQSVSGLVNATQAVVNAYEYDSFGNIISQTEGVANSYKYNGEQNDSTTGLIFLRNRNYDPVSGRFITKDIFPLDKNNPQTINPYVYVGNNPINFIDPLGLFNAWRATTSALGLGASVLGVIVGSALEAVPAGVSQILGTALLYKSGLETLTNSYQLASAFNNSIPSLPSTSVGGLVAHYGASTLGVQGQNLQVITAAGDLADASVGLGLGVKVLTNAVQSSDELGYSLSSGLQLTESSAGVLSGGIGVSQSSYDATSALLFSNTAPASFGGVDLNLTATLLGNVQDFGGATYDQATGQIILYGQQNTTLPPMDLDDLSVAVDSEYGLNGVAPADPGVSIGTQPSSVAGQMYVGYFGAVMNTGFGATLFQADRLLKTLIMGKDNITGAPVSASVPGYENMPNRYKAAGYAGYTAAQSNPIDRMWFTPQQMTLALSTDGSAMEFSQTVMQLLTSSQLNGIADTASQAVIAARPSENNFSWNFNAQDPNGLVLPIKVGSLQRNMLMGI